MTPTTVEPSAITQCPGRQRDGDPREWDELVYTASLGRCLDCRGLLSAGPRLEKVEGLLERVADKIEANPWLYEQRVWSARADCGTARCVGGWGVELAEQVALVPDQPEFCTAPAPGGHVAVFTVHNAARAMMGLVEADARLLFNENGEPAEGFTVPQALRAIAEGTPVAEVWR